MPEISPALAIIALEDGDHFALLASGEERTGTVAASSNTGCIRFVDDTTGRTMLADLSHWQSVRLDSTMLSRRADIRPYWLRDEIAADPSQLGLGDVRHAARSPRGSHSLLFDCPATGTCYVVDVQHGMCSEEQLARSAAAVRAERARSPHTPAVPVIVAERIPAALRPAIELGIEARATDAGHGIRLDMVMLAGARRPEPFVGLISAV